MTDESIAIPGRYGGPKLRDGLVVAFFHQRPFDEWAAAVGRAFEHWLTVVPPRTLAWALPSARANEAVPLRPDVLARCRAQLDPHKASQRRISAFELFGPQKTNPDWLFDVWGGLDAQRTELEPRTNYVHMRMPTAWAGEDGEQLASFARAFAELIELDSGYASLALHWSTDAELIDTSPHVPGIAIRHPGYDVHDHPELRYQLGRRCVGPRWLTFLGPELVAELGGEDRLALALAPEVVVEALPGDRGLALRVPGPPRRGDVNRGDTLPALHRMAEVLEPVTYFGIESRLFPAQTDAFDRWQRRFLDQWRS